MQARFPNFNNILALGLAAGLSLAAAVPAQVQTAALTPETVALSNPDSPVRGPVFGYVFDARTRLLRPIFGVPGAAYFSAALNLGFEVKELVVSPKQDSAIAVEAGSGRTLFVRLSGSLAESEEIVGVMPGADRIVFSPSGESAALYFRDTRQAQFLSGLRGVPESGATVDLSSLSGVLTALAVADDGETLLAAGSSRDGGEVRAFSADGSSRAVASIGRAPSMSFFHGSTDAVVADMDRSEVILARDVAGSAQTSVISSALDGVRQPVAVAVSSDNARVFAASLETGSVATIPSAGGAVALTDCSCAPRTLAPLSGDSIFRLSDDPRSAIHVLDARSPSSVSSNAVVAPRVLFIPAVADEAVTAASVPRTARGR